MVSVIMHRTFLPNIFPDRIMNNGVVATRERKQKKESKILTPVPGVKMCVLKTRW